MEFPELGQKCAADSCGELDFLPFECKFCQKIFCTKHKSTDAHECPSVARAAAGSGSSFSNFACSATGCTQREVVSIHCEHCQQQFCIRHRYPADHACSVAGDVFQLRPEQKELVMPKQPVTFQQKHPVKAKNQALANKLAVMKMKGTAVGEASIVPETDRVYFSVRLPSGSTFKGSNSTNCFVSKQWNIGRAVDSLAKTLGLINENNKPGLKQLRAFCEAEVADAAEEVTMLKMDDIVSKLLADGTLCDGGTLHLRYLYLP